MRNERKIERLVILLTVILLILCLTGTSSAALETSKKSEKKDRTIVAKVNGQPIYEDSLDPYVDKELRKFKKYSRNKDTSSLEKRLQKKVLGRVIDQELINQESQKLVIKDMEKKIDERIKVMRRKYPSEEQFKSMLEAKKLSEQDLRESTRKKIYVDEYLEKNGMRNPEVPEKKIKEYYQSNKKSFQREESIRVSHILVKVDENAEPEAKEKARAKTEKLRKELIEGKDFAEIAKEHSEDANALQGGDLGYIRRRYMPPEFDQAAFALKKDTLSSIVKTKYGYHIIKVVDKKPGGIAPYDDVKDFIIKYLQGSYARENMTSHIRELKKKADIEILLNES